MRKEKHNMFPTFVVMRQNKKEEKVEAVYVGSSLKDTLAIYMYYVEEGETVFLEAWEDDESICTIKPENIKI